MLGIFKRQKAIIIKAIVLIFIVALIVVLQVLKQDKNFCEQYSRTVQRGYLFVAGHITEHIPFSVMEVLFISLIIFGIIDIVLIIKSFVFLRVFKGISKILTVGLIISSIFLLTTVSFTFGYNRQALEIDTYDGEIKKEDFKSIVQYFLDDYNDISSRLEYKDNGEVISPYDLNQISKLLKEEYKKLDNPYLMSYTTSLKPMMSSFLYRELNITGVTFGVTGEANINVLATAAEIPFVGAHELAHTKGIFKEEEADLLAAYITLNSDDYFLRYSGYMFSFNRIMSIASYTGNSEDYSELYSALDNKIKLNSSYINKYWKDHDLLSKIGDWINDLYLKNNGIQEGIQNYGDTPTRIDEEERVITALSNYQKIYFKIYYDNL